MKPARKPIVIELEQIPPTEQRLPLPPLPLSVVPVVYALPVREYELPLPVVVTEFPLEVEEEVAELWMVEREPKVVRKVLPVYPDSARMALIEGKVFARGAGGAGGAGRAYRPDQRAAGVSPGGGVGGQGVGVYAGGAE